MPEILVEFVPDFSKLESGVDQLVSNNTISKEMAALFTDAGKSIDQFASKFSKLGGGANLKPAVDAAKKSIKDLSTSGIKDLGELQKRVQGITKSFTDGFGEGVDQALKEAGVSMEEFNNVIKTTDETGKSLKAQLREMNEELAQMKLNGQDNTEQYQVLSEKAALYRDTLQDVNEQINKQASDTRKLDTAIEFVTGLTSAFAILQGVQALAGEENEDFQKTLLKVQAAMSILVGLQQLQNILKKESNLIQAVENTQKKLAVAITALDNAATSKNVIVKGAATVAQRALNAAMNANPAFLLVTAFVALAGAITFFTGKTEDAVDETERLNNELDRTNTIVDRNIEKIKEEGELRLSAAKARGANEEELARIELGIIAKTSDAVQKGIDDNTEKFKKALSEMGSGLANLAAPNLGLSFDEFNKLAKEGTNNVDETLAVLDKIKAVRITDAFQGFSQRSKDANTAAETLLNNILKFQKLEEAGANDAVKRRDQQTEDDRKKREEDAKKAKEAREKRLKDEADARRRELEDILAQEKAKLLIQKQGTPGELQAKKDVAAAELALALDNDKLTFNQRRLLLQTFFKEQRELTEQFNESNKKKVLEDQASVIAAQLSALGLSFEEREKLTVEQLEIERDLQLAAIINNETKRKEIIAKFDKEIIEQRRKIREDAFAEEQADEDRRNFIRKKRNEEDFQNPDNTFKERKDALDELAALEAQKTQERRLFNQQQLRAGLIDEKEFSREAQDISNDEFEAKSKLQKDYTALVKEESDKRKEKFKEDLKAILGIAQQLTEAFASFQETMNANEDARIESQKANLVRLREGNAITEKEFLARMKNIEKVERETKQKQAERDKSLALFQAIINGASAVIEAAPNIPLIVATAALVAAQIAAIASRPIPRFGKGTKKAPKGLGEVGETGTELIRTEKGYYVAEHPQVIWFKGGETVFNPKETKEIFNYKETRSTNNFNNTKEKSFYTSKEKDFYNSHIEFVDREVIQTPQANTTIINNSNGVSHETKIDYDKMAKKFGDEIAKHPRLIASFDEDGFSVHLSQKLNNTKYLNKRFTFND